MRRTTQPLRQEASAKPEVEEYDIQETGQGQLTSRRGLYNASFALRMFGLAQLGLTQEQTALAFGISPRTVELWLRKYPEFRDAYEKGKDIHDHAVQTSLLKRALGYEYKEEKSVKGKDSIGRPYKYTTTTTKHNVADSTAIIFWLKNRHKEEWADVRQTQHSGSVAMGASDILKLGTLSEADLAMVERIAIAQLAAQ